MASGKKIPANAGIYNKCFNNVFTLNS